MSITLTEEQFRNRYGQQAIDKFNEVGQPEERKEDSLGFFGRVKEGLGERVGQIKETFTKTARGEISPAETGVRTVGSVFGGVGDVLGAAIEPALTPAVEKIAETDIGRTAFQKLNEGIDAYEDWKSENSTNERIGSALEGLVNIADITGTAAAGRGVVSRSIKTVEKIAEGVTDAVKPTVRRVTDFVTEQGERVLPKVKPRVEDISEYAITQVTGVPKETVRAALKNPEKFRAAQLEGLDRMTLAEKVKTVIDTELEDLSGLGKQYRPIRESGAIAIIPAGTWDDFIKSNFKFDIVDGELKKKASTVSMSKADQNALQEWYDIYGKQTELTADEFLAGRKELDRIAEFEQGKTNAATTISRQLRKKYDEFGNQINGLKELDAQFAPKIKQLSKIRKDFLDKEGNLKDSAVNAIANIGGRGKDLRLQRLQELIPDIDQQVRILKALESIEDSSDLAVGRYVRGGVIGGGVVTGNIPLILGALVATPENIVSLLTRYQKVAGVSSARIKEIIEKVKQGKRLDPESAAIVSDAIKDAAESLGGATGAAVSEGIQDSIPESDSQTIE